MISIRRLVSSDLSRIAEIDRAEHVTAEYVCVDGSLERRELDLQVPTWTPDGDHGHSVRGIMNAWRPILGRGGVLLGAFESASLIGFAIFEPELTPDMANLAALYVDRRYRGRGVGARLTQEVIELARASGARRLYVSATPTVPTVEFYRSLGFELAAEPHPEMLRAEPDDIHLILDL
jgi:GNAT superfamily N-acetyltransferase